MNQLDETVSWYGIVKANQLLAARVLSEAPNLVPNSSPFYGKSIAEATQMLEQSATEIDDLTVLSLVSFFEQLVLDYLRELAERVTIGQTEPVLGALSSYAFNDLERWRFVDVLKLFAPLVDASLLSSVENLYRYRNWVAHGKRKQKPVIADPLKTHETLLRFLRQIGQDVSSSPL